MEDEQDQEETASDESESDDDSCDVYDAIQEGTGKGNQASKSLVVMRCVIHTLQLALTDGLKSKYSSNFLAKIRNVANGFCSCHNKEKIFSHSNNG